MGRGLDLRGWVRDRWWTVVNAVMNLHDQQNARNVACFLPGRAKDLSASLYFSECKTQKKINNYFIFILLLKIFMCKKFMLVP